MTLSCDDVVTLSDCLAVMFHQCDDQWCWTVGVILSLRHTVIHCVTASSINVWAVCVTAQIDDRFFNSDIGQL